MGKASCDVRSVGVMMKGAAICRCVLVIAVGHLAACRTERGMGSRPRETAEPSRSLDFPPSGELGSWHGNTSPSLTTLLALSWLWGPKETVPFPSWLFLRGWDGASLDRTDRLATVR